MLRRSGHRVAVVIEDAAPAASERAVLDAIVVALKTRTAPRDEAVADSLAALRRLQEWGADRFYVKYCSTFDSTDEGNIGPVLDAAAHLLGAERTVVVPSLPANGRTVYEGHLFVWSELLENSPMRSHPLTPMTKSRVAEILRPQTARAVDEVFAATVRAGVTELSVALAASDASYVVVDATDDGDLATIGAATARDVLVSGGSGLALGIPGPAVADTVWQAPPPGGRVVLCGSVSTATRAQIAYAARTQPVRLIDLERAAADPAAEIESLLRWVRAQDSSAIPVICAARTASDVRPQVGGVDVAPLVEAVLTAVAVHLTDDADVTALIVAGGESSGAVVRGLGIASLHIGPELAPGVCWATATVAARPVALALKSGNFGAEDLFVAAWDVLA
jgi:uncharacterized protein YgbK (DUF1537 family)